MRSRPTPAPSHFASAELLGTTPALEFLAGTPFNAAPVPAGDAYAIGPTGQKFTLAAAIKMAYDKTGLSAKKLREESLGIYQISEDGLYLARLGNSVLNMAKGEITAEVSELHSLFVIADM